MSIRIALVGDHDRAKLAHQAIPLALDLVTKTLNVDAEVFWVPSKLLASNVEILFQFQAIWCLPGSPYKSMIGVLNAIKFARENQIPFIGTCGGFQHTLIEYARHVLNLTESDHLETNPHTSLPLITPLSCSLEGTHGNIELKPGSQVATIYNHTQITEAFNCSYGVNPDYQHLLDSTLHITGVDEVGHARVVELKDHPFFIATLYQPERSAFTGISHPLIKAFIQAAFVKRPDNQ